MRAITLDAMDAGAAEVMIAPPSTLRKLGAALSAAAKAELNHLLSRVARVDARACVAP